MVKSRTQALAGIFDDEPAIELRTDASSPETPPEASEQPPARARKDSHPNKRSVLIHIPQDMHRVLRQLSVEEDGEPITKVVERGLREYLVKRGHVRFAAAPDPAVAAKRLKGASR